MRDYAKDYKYKSWNILKKLSYSLKQKVKDWNSWKANNKLINTVFTGNINKTKSFIWKDESDVV